MYKKLVIVSTILGKKYILRQAVRKNNFPHTFIDKGVWRKKSKCVENGHSKLERPRKIKKNLYSSIKIFFRKIQTFFHIENWLWKSNFCSFLHFLTNLWKFSWADIKKIIYSSDLESKIYHVLVVQLEIFSHFCYLLGRKPR